jgi:serine/threonine protein kinase
VASGAFKETYRTTSGLKTIALKLLNPEKINIERSEREIVAMKKCDSPSIGKLLDFGIAKTASGATPYIIEEFFDGGTLTDRIARTKVSVESIRHYGITIANALKHLQSHSLVHRDIKPENLMFRAGEDDPVLVDFGLVRDLSQESLTMTWLPQGPGTPFYAPPEQLNNDKELIDWRSDQFSLGVVLSVLLTGKHPYGNANAAVGEVLNAVLRRSGCSKDFQDAVGKSGLRAVIRMVAPWPVQRYGSIDELIQELKK